MQKDAEEYVNVQTQNCENLVAKVQPRLEAVVRVPRYQATQPVVFLDTFLDLQALRELLDA